MPIFLPLTPFFLDAKVSVTKIADCRSDYVAVTVKTRWPQLKAMYSMWKGVPLDLEPVYLLGWKENKYAVMIIPNSAWRTGLYEAAATLAM